MGFCELFRSLDAGDVTQFAVLFGVESDAWRVSLSHRLGRCGLSGELDVSIDDSRLHLTVLTLRVGSHLRLRCIIVRRRISVQRR